MKHTKHLAALTAAAAALAPIASGIQPFAPAAVHALESDEAALPAWVPDDYASAEQFLSSYGATHIEDGLICVVHDSGDPQMSPLFWINDTWAPRDENCVSFRTFEQYPDADDTPFLMVLVCKPVKTGALTVSFQTVLSQTDYTFEAAADGSITETDLFGWLPDCADEYRTYSLSHPRVSVRDNYVVFCLSENAGTGTDWVETSAGSMCFAPAVVSDCTDPSEAMQDGGDAQYVYAYKAIRDGLAQIRYDSFDSMITGGGTGDSETADCVVFNDAQTVLLSGQMRVTLTDADTGELIAVSEDAYASLWTDITYNTPAGSVSTGPILMMCENPSVQENIAGHFGAASFSFGMDKSQLPAGYTLPDGTGDHEYGYFSGTVMPEDYVSVTRFDNGSADVVLRLKKQQEAPADGTVRFTFVDADTGKKLAADADDAFAFLASITYYPNDQTFLSITDENMTANPNPYIWDIGTEAAAGLKLAEINSFNFTAASLPDGWELRKDSITKTLYPNNAMDVVVPLKSTPTGDVNADGYFSVADAVLLHKYLLRMPDLQMPNWTAADYNRDGRLNAADLTLMKRALMQKQLHIYAEPTNPVEFSPPFFVETDGLKMYLGPDESTAVIAALPEGTRLFECGFMEGSDNWLLTEYQGQHGWIRTREEDGTVNVIFEALADKPVIYLYPEEETDVQVTLTLTESELATTYPRYNDGWNVTAYPDGTLLNHADGTHHRYLFWDAKNVRTRFDFSEGFCIAGSDTEQFLRETLTAMGLTESEMNEFIVYWLPRMEHNAYNLIAFQGKAYTDSAQLSISPQPDSLLRVFMAYVPLENAVAIEPQTIEAFARKGFTAVEWGGCEICAMP